MGYSKADLAAQHLRRTRALMFLGGCCTRCGINDSRVLQIDHINGGGTKEQKKIGTQGIVKQVFKFPNLYQLLCSNCNWIKKFEQKESRNVGRVVNRTTVLT